MSYTTNTRIEGWMRAKRLLAGSLAAAFALLTVLPGIAQAVGQLNLTFTTDTPVVIDGNGVNLTIQAGSDAFEIIITSTTISIQTGVGNTTTLIAPDGNQLPNDGGLGTCNLSSGQNIMTIPQNSTIVFTPSTTICTAPGGGGGGGSGSTTVTTIENTVSLTSLNGGETLAGGSTQNILWSTTGTFEDITLQLSLDGGLTYSNIVIGTQNDGNYAWVVPNVSTTSARLKLIGRDNGGGTRDTDIGDANFTITSDATQPLDQLPVGLTPGNPEGFPTGAQIAPLTGETGNSPVTGLPEAISAIAPGQFVTSKSLPSVYFITENMTRRPFFDAQAYFTYSNSFDDIIWVTDATLPTMTLDGPMLPKAGVVLVKIQSDNRVFAVEDVNGVYTLRWITSEDIATAVYGSNWADYVIDIAPTLIGQYAVGADIIAPESVDMSIMKTRISISELIAG